MYSDRAMRSRFFLASITFLGLALPIQVAPLQCLDARGRVVVPAAAIREVGPGVSRPEIVEPLRLTWPEGSQPLGTIILESVIDASGRVCAVRVLKTPAKAISERAVAALRKSTFKPARLKGQTVAVRYLLAGFPHPG